LDAADLLDQQTRYDVSGATGRDWQDNFDRSCLR
jgi:hypothetical protein